MRPGHGVLPPPHCPCSSAHHQAPELYMRNPQGPIKEFFLNKPSAFLRGLMGTAVNMVTFSTSFNLC